MIFLIITDLFWSGAALIVDLPKLADIPPWAWPVVMICPIYPLLLAIVWFQIIYRKRSNQYLLAFAAIPSAVFGVLALVFYPLKLSALGWDSNAFGQIFWVLVYSIQGWYLLFRYKTGFRPAALAILYLFVKFTLDYKFNTFGYLDFAGLSNVAVLSLYIVALAVSVAGFFILLSSRAKEKQSRRSNA